MATITNINNTPVVSPENAKFVAIKDGKPVRVDLVDYIKKNFTGATTEIKDIEKQCSSSINAMEKKLSSSIEDIQKQFSELKAAFDALNAVIPVEEVATEESSKKSKKSKKSAE